jgi:hypothetical protein
MFTNSPDESRNRVTIKKIFAGVIAVVGSAALTLFAIIGLVRGTIYTIGIESLPLRVLGLAGDVLIGTLLLVGCIYLATHLAVRIVGVGQAALIPPADTR